MDQLKKKKGFICDMDGVLYHGNQLLPGVERFVNWLTEEKKNYLFLTNSSQYTPKELQQAVQHIKIRHCDATSGKFNLVLPSNDLAELSSALGDNLACSVVRRWPPKADQQLASVILWALEHDSISTNMLMKEYGFGWNTASKLVSRLEELRIVGRPDGKLPRDVIPGCPEDIPEEIIKFLEATGYSKGSVINAIYSR